MHFINETALLDISRYKGKKVQQSHNTPMEAQGGRGGIAPTHSRPRNLKRVSGQRHASAALYPWGMDSQYPLDRKLGGPQSRSGQEVRGNILLPLPGIEPGSPCRPVRSHTLYTLSYRHSWYRCVFQTNSHWSVTSCKWEGYMVYPSIWLLCTSLLRRLKLPVYFNISKHSGEYMHHLLQYSVKLRFVHRVYLYYRFRMILKINRYYFLKQH
jgi:hypothetical protein